MAKLLWTPARKRVEDSNLTRFIEFVNRRHGYRFTDYTDLYAWSVQHLDEFWAAVWDFVGIVAERRYDRVIDDSTRLPGAHWFEGAQLNFAANLLRVDGDREAIVFQGEGRKPTRMTYAALRSEVARVRSGLQALGIGPGDRVAGFMPNLPQTTIAMLAATSLGAIWSSCSPDFGLKGVLDRFGQVAPRVLFTADGYTFKGKTFDSLGRVSEIQAQLPSIERVVVVPYANPGADPGRVQRGVHWDDFGTPGAPLAFTPLPFEHPLYIMYTSGTTGLPKCLVQSAGGVLINHLKELVLHADLKPEDTIFYYTTCGWMMWNWLMSSLAVGSRMVLFDGNPFHPEPEALFGLAQNERISIFGTSAAYLAALEAQGGSPGKRYDLSSLRTILSTGSPLSVESFEYVYRHIKNDVHLASISGGTDINGCFVGGNPVGPVHSGEIQARCLGMKVEAFDDTGKPIRDERGELVCLAPSPSMPLRFWNDPDGRRYREAYFERFPGVWHHGDFVIITQGGGVVMLGRSDATLNPGGVRIGTAEIYRLVEGLPEIQDSLVIGQDWKGDVRVVLFVKLAPGHELTQALKDKIKKTLRELASPRHVPAKIIAAPDFPYTMNMKKVEIAVRKVLAGQAVLNRDALRNPEALDFFAEIPELEQD